jgi:hypothetical protein
MGANFAVTVEFGRHDKHSLCESLRDLQSGRFISAGCFQRFGIRLMLIFYWVIVSLLLVNRSFSYRHSIMRPISADVKSDLPAATSMDAYSDQDKS